jgi:hypothetical protein
MFHNVLQEMWLTSEIVVPWLPFLAPSCHFKPKEELWKIQIVHDAKI